MPDSACQEEVDRGNSFSLDKDRRDGQQTEVVGPGLDSFSIQICQHVLLSQAFAADGEPAEQLCGRFLRAS